MTRNVVTAFAAVAVLAGTAAAQTGSISGRVTDAESLAPVVGASVDVVSADGTVAARTSTGSDGRFRVLNLRPATYAIVVRLIGFDTYRREGVQVVADAVAEVNIEMRSRALALDEVVVSASRRQERALEAPARVEIVGREDIQRRPTLTPVDHLRGVPGVDIATTGLQSTNVVARGFNNVFSGALNALTDHRIAGVPSLRVNFLHFVPVTNEDIERMEVVLGPGAALYGPNTANGVLHIFTRSPLTEQGTVGSFGVGERSVLHGTVRTAHRFGDNFGIKFSGQFLQGDEWEYQDPAEVFERRKFDGLEGPTPDAAANRAFWRADLMRATGTDAAEAGRRADRIGNRDFALERWSGEVRADWNPTQNIETVFSAGVTNIASAVELTGLGAAQVNDWKNMYYQARATWGRAFAQVYLNASDAGDTYLLRNGTPIVDESKLLVAQLQHGISIGRSQNFTYGIDFLHTMPETRGTINGIYEDEDETKEFGAYIHSETRLNPMVDLVLAGRVDTHTALPDAIFSPRAAIVVKPSRDQAFRVSFNKAFSTPSSLNQFLDLGTSIPVPALAQLGYSIRVQGTGRDGFNLRQPDGSYLMRSPFHPANPASLVPAHAVLFWQAAVQVVAQQAAAQGAPLPPQMVQYLLSLAPTPAQISSNYLNPAAADPQSRPLSALDLRPVDPIRESTSTSFEVGYKGILGGRFLLAADLWYAEQKNFVTPLTIMSPLILLNGPQTVGFLTQRFMQDLGMPQAQAQATATQIGAGMAQVPLGVISAAEVNANGAQLLMTYTNVDDKINLWGTDLSFTALLTDRWSLGMTASLVNEDSFESRQGILVTLNAPKRKGSVSLRYRDVVSGLEGEARVRHHGAYPVNSGVYVGTECLLGPGDVRPAFVEPCISSATLVDLNVGVRMPGFQQASLQLAIQNLLDESYRSFPGIPDMGRMGILRLRYEF